MQKQYKSDTGKITRDKTNQNSHIPYNSYRHRHFILD